MKKAMPWQKAGIPQDAVEQAMDRCERMGRDAFRKDTHAGFKAAKGKRVMYKKRHKERGPFEPRPLVAAAYAFSYPEQPPLGPKDFVGDTARQYLLRYHGFTLEGEAPVRDSDSDPQTEQTVAIDGVNYSLDHLSSTARQALAKLRNADTAIKQLQQRLAIHQTARSAYAQTLSDELPKQATQ